MDSELWILITIVRMENMDMLKYVHRTSTDSFLGQNFMFWGEEDVMRAYLEIFDYDDQVVILDAEEIQGIK